MKLLLGALLSAGCAVTVSQDVPGEVQTVINEVRVTMRRATMGREPPPVTIKEIPGAGMYEVLRNGVPVIYVNPVILQNIMAVRLVLAHEFSHWGLRHGEQCLGRIRECEHEANVAAVWVIQQTWPTFNGIYFLCLWLKMTTDNQMGHDPTWEFEQFRARFGLGEKCQ